VALQQPNAQARRMFLSEIYSTDHVMGQLAEAIDYQAVNADMLKSYHKQWYHHRNVTVYMAGHITQECLDLVTQAFGEPFGEIPQGGEVHFAPVPQRPAKQLFKEMPGKAQSSVLIGKSTIGLHHPDCMQLRVLITLLGGFFGSRLMSTVREEKGLTYGIYAVLNPSPYDNALMILSDCDHRFVQPLLSETYHQIDRLQNELVSDNELALVRSTMKGELMRTYDSRLSLNDAWIYLHTQGLPDDYFHRYWQAISNVTSEDLQRLAGTYLGKDTLTEIVVGEKMS
jgi:predicted Zn-dependent peptidase